MVTFYQQQISLSVTGIFSVERKILKIACWCKICIQYWDYSVRKRDLKLIWELRINHIRKCLFHKQGSINVTLVFYAKDTNGKYSHIPHDRFLITNYRLFTSGDSFCYFNSNNENISNGSFLQVDSLVKYENLIIVDSMLEWLQQLYNSIKRLNNDMLIIGDKKSSLLQM